METMRGVESEPDANLPRWRVVLLRLGSAAALIACLLAGVFAAGMAFLGLLLALDGVSFKAEDIAQLAAAVGISLLGAKTFRWLVAPPADDRRKSVVAAALVCSTALLALRVFLLFSLVIRENADGRTRAELHVIRDALKQYHGDMEGQYPSDLTALTIGGKYLYQLPPVRTWHYHADSSVVRPGKVPTDEGGWLYDDVHGDSNYGSIWVNCTHTDTRGSVWSSY